MRLNSVVFPAPFGPMMERTSPRATARLTRCTATSPPNRRVSSRVSSIAHGRYDFMAGSQPVVPQGLRSALGLLTPST